MTGAPPPVPFVFLNEVGIIDQLAQTRLERALPGGLRVAHFVVLNHLVRLGDGRTPLELARAFQVTKGAMTNTLQRLEGQGLIRLHPDAVDGRSKRVRLTAKGRATRDRAIAALAPLFDALLRAVPEAELAAALPLLGRVRRWLDENR